MGRSEYIIFRGSPDGVAYGTMTTAPDAASIIVRPAIYHTALTVTIWANHKQMLLVLPYLCQHVDITLQIKSVEKSSKNCGESETPPIFRMNPKI